MSLTFHFCAIQRVLYHLQIGQCPMIHLLESSRLAIIWTTPDFSTKKTRTFLISLGTAIIRNNCQIKNIFRHFKTVFSSFSTVVMRTTLFSLLFASIIAISSAKYVYRFTKINCTTSGKTISNLTCYIKSYDRRNPIINVEFKINRRIGNDGMVKIN